MKKMILIDKINKGAVIIHVYKKVLIIKFIFLYLSFLDYINCLSSNANYKLELN